MSLVTEQTSTGMAKHSPHSDPWSLVPDPDLAVGTLTGTAMSSAVDCGFDALRTF